MRRLRRPSLAAIGISASLLLAGSSGFLTATAFGTGAQATRTVTINVATGPSGPKGDTGPSGPKGDTGATGPAGSGQCPAGFDAGELVINHPGGQTVIWTCLKNR